MPDVTPLEHVLTDLQAALLRGDLPALDGLLDQVAAAAAAGIPADQGAARRLQALAGRNDMLLAAALRGLRAARRRLAELRAARAGFATYDATGRRTEHRGAASALCKRF